MNSAVPAEFERWVRVCHYKGRDIYQWVKSGKIRLTAAVATNDPGGARAGEPTAGGTRERETSPEGLGSGKRARRG